MSGIESMYDDMPNKNDFFRKMLFWDAVDADNYRKGKRPHVWDLDRPSATLRKIYGSRILAALGIND